MFVYSSCFPSAMTRYRVFALAVDFLVFFRALSSLGCGLLCLFVLFCAFMLLCAFYVLFFVLLLCLFVLFSGFCAFLFFCAFLILWANVVFD